MRVHIDWVNGVVPFPHSTRIDGGVTRKENHDGNLEWAFKNKRIVRPSFDASITIQSSDDHFETDPDTGEIRWTHVHVTGSPKPLQGHNVWGPQCPLLLLAHLARAALKVVGYNVDLFTFHRWKKGDSVKITRVDITRMMWCESQNEAETWIRAMDKSARLKFRGLAHVKGGTTLTFGDDESSRKSSRYWNLKIYTKWTEIMSRAKGHRLFFPQGTAEYDALTEYAWASLRFEVVILGKELKRRNLESGPEWLKTDINALWGEFMQKLELPVSYVAPDKCFDLLTRAEFSTYSLWKDGADIISKLSVATRYRHRKIIREKVGIDIFVPKTADEGKAKVIPLVRLIEAVPRPYPERVLRDNWLMIA